VSGFAILSEGLHKSVLLVIAAFSAGGLFTAMAPVFRVKRKLV
jgi:hypothetical protein